MAEIVGVAASVIAVIQIADRIVGLCKFYIESISDTPSDLLGILIEISTLKTVFENLEFLITSHNTASVMLKLLSDPNGPIEGCLKSVTELERLFPSDSVNISGRSASRSKRRKVKTAYATLAWPLKALNAQRLLQRIIQFKTSISLALTTELTQDIKDMKKKNDEIRNILTNSQCQEVYRWLEHTDPSPLHNKARKHYEAGTGNWILRSRSWTNWLDAQHRCLWIHGIPGAGKTVLTSFLVEQIKKQCDQSSKGKYFYAYYYCYFGRGQDEATPFLRWIVCQLCRQTSFIPNEVQKLHKSGGEPSLEGLLAAIEAVLESCEVAYVVIDAMDESNPRGDLLKVIRDLATDARFSKIQVLATSRDYVDIERTMENISESVSMSNPLVEEDIRICVRSNLHSNEKFRHWPKDLLDETEEAVTRGAKGMFRWAVCQLDVLQRLKCESNIVKRALATLPKTLDETYDRVFLCIPQEEWAFVHRAMQWVHYHNELYFGKSIPCSTLLQAISVDPLSEGSHDQFYDVDRLRELCGCLISVTTEDTDVTDPSGVDRVSFAHYTVREYLDSSRISKGPTAYFAINTEAVKQQCTEIAIFQAQNIQLNEEWVLKDFELDLPDFYNSPYEDFAFYCVGSALVSFTKWQEEIYQLNKLFDLVIELLDPSKPHFGSLCLVANWIDVHTDLFDDVDLFEEFQFSRVSWRTDPDKTDAVLLLHLLLQSELSTPWLARKFLEQRDDRNFLSSRLHFNKPVWYVLSEDDRDTYEFDGSIIEVMAQCAFQNFSNFELMLDYGMGLFDPSHVLLSFIGSHESGGDLLLRLLQAGADPNVKGYRVMPLQIATVSWDYEGVEILLKAGADPNSTGDINGVEWEAGTLLSRFNFLHKSSPLHICRHFDCIFQGDRRKERVSNVNSIESLLLQHGARAVTER